VKLYDDDWRALVDLVIPSRVDEPHLGVSIPAGAMIPEPLQPAVEAMTPRKRKGG
jgi:hypothetical protein